jgi:hypothetical protein
VTQLLASLGKHTFNPAKQENDHLELINTPAYFDQLSPLSMHKIIFIDECRKNAKKDGQVSQHTTFHLTRMDCAVSMVLLRMLLPSAIKNIRKRAVSPLMSLLLNYNLVLLKGVLQRASTIWLKPNHNHCGK